MAYIVQRHRQSVVQTLAALRIVERGRDGMIGSTRRGEMLLPVRERWREARACPAQCAAAMFSQDTAARSTTSGERLFVLYATFDIMMRCAALPERAFAVQIADSSVYCPVLSPVHYEHIPSHATPFTATMLLRAHGRVRTILPFSFQSPALPRRHAWRRACRQARHQVPCTQNRQARERRGAERRRCEGAVVPQCRALAARPR